MLPTRPPPPMMLTFIVNSSLLPLGLAAVRPAARSYELPLSVLQGRQDLIRNNAHQRFEIVDCRRLPIAANVAVAGFALERLGLRRILTVPTFENAVAA